MENRIHSQQLWPAQSARAGAVYLISVPGLASADAADGQTDRVVDLSHIAAQPNSWKLRNGFDWDWARRPLSIVYDGVGTTAWLTLANNILPGADLAPTDAADGAEDGVVDLKRSPAADSSSSATIRLARLAHRRRRWGRFSAKVAARAPTRVSLLSSQLLT